MAISRREFLKAAGVMGVGTVLAGCMKTGAETMAPEPTLGEKAVTALVTAVLQEASNPSVPVNTETPKAEVTPTVVYRAEGGSYTPEQQALIDAGEFRKWEDAAANFWRYWAGASQPAVSGDLLKDGRELPIVPKFDPADPNNPNKALVYIDIPFGDGDCIALPWVNNKTQLIPPDAYATGPNGEKVVETGQGPLPLTKNGVNERGVPYELSVRDAMWVQRIPATPEVVSMLDRWGYWRDVRLGMTGTDDSKVQCPQPFIDGLRRIETGPVGEMEAYFRRTFNNPEGNPATEEVLLMVKENGGDPNQKWKLAPYGMVIENGVWKKWEPHQNSNGNWVLWSEEGVVKYNQPGKLPTEVLQTAALVESVLAKPAVPGEATMFSDHILNFGMDFKPGKGREAQVLMLEAFLQSKELGKINFWQEKGFSGSTVEAFEDWLKTQTNGPEPGRWGWVPGLKYIANQYTKGNYFYNCQPGGYLDSIQAVACTMIAWKNDPFARSYLCDLMQENPSTLHGDYDNNGDFWRVLGLQKSSRSNLIFLEADVKFTNRSDEFAKIMMLGGPEQVLSEERDTKILTADFLLYGELMKKVNFEDGNPYLYFIASVPGCCEYRQPLVDLFTFTNDQILFEAKK